jgi:hypothetical protein
MKPLFILVPLALIGVLVMSCSKDHSLNSDGRRISKVVFTGDSVVSYTYQYDKKSRLASIITGFNNLSEADRISLFYGADGKLSGCSFDGGKEIFYYSSTGRIVERIVSFARDNNDTIENFYDYDAVGRLISDSSFWKGQITSLRKRFNYDGNGNVATVENSTYFNGLARATLMEEYEYDNKPNPYQGIGQMGYYIEGETVFLDKNNRVHQKWQNNLGMTVTLDARFEYNGNGLPGKSNCTYTPAGYLNLNKVEYFYE